MTALLDTHQHLIYPDRFGYGWTAGIDALEGRAFRLEDYRALAEGLGIGGTLFMEAAVDDAGWAGEAPFIADLAAEPGSGVVGLIATCRPEAPDGVAAEIDRAGELGIKGFRRILHVVDDTMSQSDTFRTNVRRIGEAGMVFDMCFLARQLPVALELAKACDNTALVLDHCGVPDIAGGGLDPWRADIAALAALPNVNCKLSGLLAYCPPGQGNLETIRPYADHVLEAFGPQRIVWGSDWPVVDINADLPGWIAVTRQFLAALSDDEAAAIAHRNAARLYGVSLG